MTATETKPRIIVGLDGSQGSEDALRWAAQYADVSGADVDAVIAWSLPEVYAYVPRDYAADARAALVHSVERALGPDGLERVTLHVIEAHPRCGADLDVPARPTAGRGQARPRRVRRHDDGLGEPTLRPACMLPGRRRP